MNIVAVLSLPELLAEVFTYLVDVWPAPDMSLRGHRQYIDGHSTQTQKAPPRPSDYDPLRNGSPIMAWVNVTFVCVSWRQLAICTPTLWTDINEGLNDQWLKTFVERSGETLLTVGNRDRGQTRPLHYDSLAIDDPLKVDNTLPKLWPRVRHLHLTYDGFYLSSTVMDLLGRPSAQIERCELMGNDSKDDVIAEHGLFAGDAPLLRHFFCRLHRVTFPWTATFISQLRSLVLSCQWGLPPLTELVDTLLPNMKVIERLDLGILSSLDEAPLLSEDAIVVKSRPVELPYIRHLGLEGDAISIAFVFTHVSFPDTAGVELRCDDYTEDDITRFLFPVINSHYRDWLNLTPLTLYINSDRIFGGYDNMHVCVWPTSDTDVDVDDPHYEYNTRPSSIMLKLERDDDPDILRKLIMSVHPFSRTTCLHALFDHWCPSAHYAYIFRRTPQIETLYISHWDKLNVASCREKLFRIFDALLESASAVAEDHTSVANILLPNLRSLDIAIDVPGIWCPHELLEPSEETGMPLLIEQLRELVQARTSEGFPLRSLHILPSSLKIPRSDGDGNAQSGEDKYVVVPSEVRALMA